MIRLQIMITRSITFINKNFLYIIMEEIAQAIRSWNPWWKEKQENSSWILRQMLHPIIESLQTRHIKDILGIRRSGKTTLLHQIIDYLLNKGIPSSEILFLVFDDPILISTPFNKILDASLYLHSKIKYLFIDEVHAKEGWELWVKKIYDTKQFSQIFISGSNAAILSDDIGKALTGRHLSFYLTPFMFHEYLTVINWNSFNQDYLKGNFPQLLHEFDTYLIWGGFPEIIKLNPSLKRQVLIDLYNDVLARDISTRASIDHQKMNNLTIYFLTNFTREYSINKLAKSIQLHPDTIRNYINLLENALMIKIIHRFSYKLKNQFRQNKKIYVVDNGLRNAVAFHTTQDLGKYAENLVCMEIIRRGKEVFYWKDNKHEVDFIVRVGGQIEAIIQVSWNMKNMATRKREYEGLVAACHLYKCKVGLILTRDEEKTEQYKDIEIKIRPIALWLLND